MKWTTANTKSTNYTANHEIYVGTQTGSFKKLTPADEEKPYAQCNLQQLSNLDKDSRVTVLEFDSKDQSNILIGRAQNTVELYSLQNDRLLQSVQLEETPVVGLACYGDQQLVAGFGTGKLQQISLSTESQSKTPTLLYSSGDNMSHMRQCSVQRNLVATGGKERQNNLKVFDMEAGGKQIFTSKNLPHDFLQLEVPVWDSDVGFIDSPHTLATCSRYGYVRVYDTRKQRRPVQCYATEEQMSFATLAAKGNYIYTGTTMGVMKAFDIRRMKTFVHTYKGFTGGISDLSLDATGKYLASASLDRYVRVHHADSCVLLYQCYVKSKATRVLLRECAQNSNAQSETAAEVDDENEVQGAKSKHLKKRATEEDKEYDAMFDNMQTICENDSNDEEANDDKNSKAQTTAKNFENVRAGTKRKNKSKANKNKKKKQ